MKSIKSLVFIYFLAFIFLTLCLSSTSYATPAPDIKANNVDSAVFLVSSCTLSITVSNDAGTSVGMNADWWVAADTPFGWHYYIYPYGWYYAPDLSDIQPAYQGALFTLGTVEVLNITGLPEGIYTFYFAVDTIMNGQIDFDHLYYDGVVIVIDNEIGPVPFKRTPSLGMYGLGTSIEPEVDTLSTTPTLSDEIYDIPASTPLVTINLGSNGDRYNNIGIQLFSSDQSVDALYIYVNEDVSFDTVLSNPNNWRVYASDFNLEGTWTEVAIQSVTITEYFDEDISELVDVYRYEIRFTTPQNKLYFNAVNFETVFSRDVRVTEIEAYGPEECIY